MLIACEDLLLEFFSLEKLTGFIMTDGNRFVSGSKHKNRAGFRPAPVLVFCVDLESRGAIRVVLGSNLENSSYCSVGDEHC